MYIFKSENCNILVCTLDADIPTINLQMFVNWRQVFDRKLFMTYYYKTISLRVRCLLKIRLFMPTENIV